MHYLKHHPETSTLTGELLVCDSPTLTGRTYPIDEVKHAVVMLRPRIAGNTVLGELGMSFNTDFMRPVDLTKVAVQVIEVHIRGKKLYGTLKILNTDSGNLLKSMINANRKFKAAMTAIGTITHGTVTGITIITFNVVLV